MDTLAIRHSVEDHKARGTKRAVVQRAFCELSPALADEIRAIVADVYADESSHDVHNWQNPADRPFLAANCDRCKAELDLRSAQDAALVGASS